MDKDLIAVLDSIEKALAGVSKNKKIKKFREIVRKNMVRNLLLGNGIMFKNTNESCRIPLENVENEWY